MSYRQTDPPQSEDTNITARLLWLISGVIVFIVVLLFLAPYKDNQVPNSSASTPVKYVSQEEVEAQAKIGQEKMDAEMAEAARIDAANEAYERAYINEQADEDARVDAGVNNSPPNSACVIKGNISVRTGEKIYHLPGQSFYNKTIVNPSRGERWFCTESDAQKNGWRKSEV